MNSCPILTTNGAIYELLNCTMLDSELLQTAKLEIVNGKAHIMLSQGVNTMERRGCEYGGVFEEYMITEVGPHGCPSHSRLSQI
ncbi:hypothetical protein L596_006080 [Steinernema carpocapsae]|nr:hypothetical protein L596_006080 [Steinernema carpocapsae]